MSVKLKISLGLGLIILIAIGSFLMPKQIKEEAKNLGATILFPSGGGTGIGTATTSDIGKAIIVSSSNPLTYKFGTVSGGSGGSIFVDNLSALTPNGDGFVTSTHNLNLAHPLVQLWNGNVLIQNTIYPSDGIYAYIRIVDANSIAVDYSSIASAIGANLSTLYLVVGGAGPQGPAGQGVSTSTANYFTFYDSANSVTGTPLMQFSNGAITVTTNTSFVNIALPQTSSTTYGMITNGAYTWLHNYGAPGAQRWNTFLGVGAGNTTFTSDTMFTTGIGAFALNAITTGTQNTGIGHGVMQYATTGSENTGVGSGALYSNLTGNKNVAVGLSAATGLQTGNSNIAVGYSAYGNATSGNSNTAIGTAALYNNNADYNVAVGHQAMSLTTSGGLNQAFGFQSLYNNLGGSQNSAYGNSSLYNNTTGIGNTAIGGFSLYYNTGGIYNTVVGYQAGLGAGNTGLLYNTLLGTFATSLLAGAQYSTALGYNAQVTASNQMVLGGTNITQTLLRGNVGVNTTTFPATLSVRATTGTIPFDVASSSSASLLRVLANGNIGINSSSPGAQLSITGFDGTNPLLITSSSGALFLSIDNLGNVSTQNGGFYYEASSSISYLASMQTGPLNSENNPGVIFGLNGLVTSVSPTGTPNGWLFGLNDTGILTVYTESAGSGNIKNKRVGVNSTTPFASLAVQGEAGSDLVSFATSTGAITLKIDQYGQLLSLTYPVNTTSTISNNIIDPDIINATTAATTIAVYSDDITRMLTVSTAANGALSLKSSTLSPLNTLQTAFYNNAGVLQTITAQTALSIGSSFRGAVTYQGYHYAMVVSTTTGVYVVKRATSTWSNNLSAFANWATTTISGTTLTSTHLGIVGAANGNLYIASSTTVVSPFSITTSTNTLTAGANITISGASMALATTRVNENGIYAAFGSAPFVRKYNFSGVAQAPFGSGKGASAPSGTGPDVFVLPFSYYSLNGTMLFKNIGF